MSDTNQIPILSARVFFFCFSLNVAFSFPFALPSHEFEFISINASNLHSHWGDIRQSRFPCLLCIVNKKNPSTYLICVYQWLYFPFLYAVFVKWIFLRSIGF